MRLVNLGPWIFDSGLLLDGKLHDLELWHTRLRIVSHYVEDDSVADL